MNWDIAYNTSQEELLFTEYGRTVQELLQKAHEIPDADRQAYVERVIQLMQQMSPDVKQQENYEARLWKHAFKIAGGQLDVKVPEGIDATPEEEGESAPLPPYPTTDLKKRPVYGRNVLQLIERGKAMPDGPDRDYLTYMAAYYMKVALTDWNGGKFYNEDMIRKDLYELSDKQLVLPREAKLGSPSGNQPSQEDGLGKRKKKKKKKNNQNRQHNSNRSRNKRSRGRR